MSRRAVIAVHLGAGPPCSTVKQTIYENICKAACKGAMKILQRGGNAVDAACEAVRILEDSPYTNAGIGSNLTSCGKVECDAAVMNGKTLNCGAVGALPDIKNPVLVAKVLLQEQDKGLLSLGRIPPCLIVSEGAKQWAIEHGFRTTDRSTMITARARKIYQKNKKILQSEHLRKKMRLDIEESTDSSQNVALSSPLDTVGAVCVDTSGNVASAVSSGGIVLKHSGRVGQAAVFAAGCWAENGSISDKNSATFGDKNDCGVGYDEVDAAQSPVHNLTDINPSVAVATTGVGENLIKTMFSRECANSVKVTNNPHESLKNIFGKCFLKHLKTNEEKLAGVLLLRCEYDRTEVLVGHTSACMCYGYLKQGSSKVNVTMSNLPAGSQPGTCVHIQGTMIR